MTSMEQFDFTHFNRCANLVDKYLGLNNHHNVTKILDVIASVWTKHTGTKIEIVVLSTSLGISVKVLTRVVYLEADSQDPQMVQLRSAIENLCEAILNIFKESDRRLLPDFPKTEEIQALQDVLSHLCEIAVLMKDNSMKFLGTVYVIVKTAVQNVSVLLKPCDFKSKLISVICDQIEHHATLILADEDCVTQASFKAVKFLIDRLIDFAGAFQNTHFGGGVAVIELLYWLLKVENTANVTDEQVDPIHRGVTVGLMGILKHIYVDEDVAYKILQLGPSQLNEVNSVYLIFSELIKLLKKDRGPGLKCYFNTADNLFEQLFNSALKLGSFFLEDLKQAELIGQLTLCIIFASKARTFNHIDTFLMQHFKTSTDTRTLYLTMNCYQSIARICNQTVGMAYFKRFDRLYRGGLMNPLQIYALKLLCKSFFVCLPKKLKVNYLSQYNVMHQSKRLLVLGLQMIEPKKIADVEIDIKYLAEAFPSGQGDYQKLIYFLLMFNDTPPPSLLFDPLFKLLKMLVTSNNPKAFVTLIEAIVLCLSSTKRAINQEKANFILDCLLQSKILDLSTFTTLRFLYNVTSLNNSSIQPKLQKLIELKLSKPYDKELSRKVLSKQSIINIFESFELQVNILSTNEDGGQSSSHSSGVLINSQSSQIKSQPSQIKSETPPLTMLLNSQSLSLSLLEEDEENEEPLAKKQRVGSSPKQRSQGDWLDQMLKLVSDNSIDCKLSIDNKRKAAKIVNCLQKLLRNS